MSTPVLTWAERSRKVEATIDELIAKSFAHGSIPSKDEVATLGYLVETTNNMRYFRDIAVERGKITSIAQALEGIAADMALSEGTREGLRLSARTLYEIDI